MMYSWANRPDTRVVDEPMYAYYLKKTGINYHPGTKETLASLPHDWSQVIETLILGPVDKDIYFIKGMAHHYLDDDISFLLQLKNVFLIRNPKQLIASFSKIIETPTMQDIGLKREWELYQYLVENGKTPLVLDSNQVLSNPRAVLSAVCSHLSVPFEEAMLSWPTGPIAEDGAWGPHWYHNVWKSNGWSTPDNSKREIRADLLPLLEEAQMYYDLLSERRLKV
jgi:hypothetical protein